MINVFDIPTGELVVKSMIVLPEHPTWAMTVSFVNTSKYRINRHLDPGHSSVTGTSRNDFFPGCFLAPGFLSGKNRRIPIDSYRFQKGPARDRLESYRNCPKTSDRDPGAKNQSKTARKRSEAAKTGGIRYRNRRNRPAF